MATPSQLSSLSSHQNAYTQALFPPTHRQPGLVFSAQTACNKALSADGICLRIFTFISTSSLMNTTCYVSRKWKELSNDEEIWQERLPQNIKDDFTPLVIKNLMNWKEVHFYARLSPFIASMIEDRYSQQDFIMSKNQQLHIMPTPFVQYGRFHFAIYGLTNIEVTEERNPESFVLKDKTGRILTHLNIDSDDLLALREQDGVHYWNYDGSIIEERNLAVSVLNAETGKMLTHLAVEGDYVFAFREDGIIDVWDYKRRKKMEGIPTAYCTGSEEFGQAQRRTIGGLFCQNFYIKNGMIIIKYRLGAKESLEIISYESPTRRQFHKDFPLEEILCIEVLENNRIIILGRTNQYQRSIWETNFSTKTETYTPSVHHHLIWTTLAQNSLENTTTKTPITQPSYPWPDLNIDGYNNTWIETLAPSPIETLTSSSSSNEIVPPPKSYPTCKPRVIPMNSCTVIENLIFVFNSPSDMRVDLVRIDSEDEGKFNRLSMPSLPLDFDTSEWRINLLAYLILKAKKELGGATTSQSSTSTHNPSSNAQT